MSEVNVLITNFLNGLGGTNKILLGLVLAWNDDAALILAVN